MIFADTAGPSSSNVAAFVGAGPSNTSAAPALLPLLVYQAPARATSLAPHAVYSAQAPAAGQPPLVYQQQQQQQQQQQPVAAARAGRGRRRKLGDSNDGGSSSHGRGSVAGSFESKPFTLILILMSCYFHHVMHLSACPYPFTAGGQPTGRQEQMNVTEGQESYGDDVVPSHQQVPFSSKIIVLSIRTCIFPFPTIICSISNLRNPSQKSVIFDF
jgi:hypothetical protein